MVNEACAEGLEPWLMGGPTSCHLPRSWLPTPLFSSVPTLWPWGLGASATRVRSDVDTPWHLRVGHDRNHPCLLCPKLTAPRYIWWMNQQRWASLPPSVQVSIPLVGMLQFPWDIKPAGRGDAWLEVFAPSQGKMPQPHSWQEDMDSQWAALEVMGWVPQAPVKVCRYPMSTPVLERVALNRKLKTPW